MPELLIIIKYIDYIIIFTNSLEELVDMSELLIRELNSISLLKLNIEKIKDPHTNIANGNKDIICLYIHRDLISTLTPQRTSEVLRANTIDIEQPN